MDPWRDFDDVNAPQVSPPVIGHGDDQYESPEDIVYVPSQRFREGDQETVLELRRTEDGRLAMLAYSTLEELVAGCGPYQPWVSFFTDRIDEVRQMCGAEVVLWNTDLPQELQHGPAGAQVKEEQ